MACRGSDRPPTDKPDLILHRGSFTTLDRSNPVATAVAIKDGRFVAVGREGDVLPLAGPATRVIDLRGRQALPGLIDNHLHIIRGGLNFNMELRWDGVRSLADAMAMLRRQVAVTPPPQWVRVVGGFTEQQFAERRLPTIAELNAAAPDTPVFVLHLYDRALLNAAALRAVGYTRETPAPPGGEIVRDGKGDPTGLLLAKPNAGILYVTLAKGPKLPFEYQLNSTRHFMRELNRLGVTGAIDAGGGFQNYPEDYAVAQKRYGQGAAGTTPPLAQMLEAGIPLSAGTDATRVASYNPWVSLAWLVTGRTVGGLKIYPQRNCLDRETALRMWTEKVTWFSNEEGKKGRIEVGQLADLIVPDRDYFSCPEEEIAEITADLTIVGGRIVYGGRDFARFDEDAPPPAMPDWSPVRHFGGYAAWASPPTTKSAATMRREASACGCPRRCGIHGHDHARAWPNRVAVSDFRAFWGAFGCTCWAV